MPPRKRARLSPKSNEWPKSKRIRPPPSASKFGERGDTAVMNDAAEQHQASDQEHQTNDIGIEEEFDDGFIDEMVSDSPSTADDGKQASKSGTKFAGPEGFDSLKSFKGQVYSGASVGFTHRWSYDEGPWVETKVEPDLWKIDFETNKKRTQNAPNGSGAPVGTEYHWLGSWSPGSKYKLAYKNASSSSWSINSVKKQREREVFLLQDAIKRVEGLPPVLGTEKVKTPKKKENGQLSIANMLAAGKEKKMRASETAKGE